MLAICVMALAGCGRDQPAALLVGTSTFAPGEREPMPDLSGTTLTGDELRLSDLRGRVVVLNAWASWCGPCVDEVPEFVTLADQVDPGEVAVVGLNVSDESSAAKSFAEDTGIDYPSIIDADGSLLPTIPGVPPRSIPSTVVLDRDGRVAARVIGTVDAAALQQIVTDVTAE